jgi:hypothetical protein
MVSVLQGMADDFRKHTAPSLEECITMHIEVFGGSHDTVQYVEYSQNALPSLKQVASEAMVRAH